MLSASYANLFLTTTATAQSTFQSTATAQSTFRSAAGSTFQSTDHPTDTSAYQSSDHCYLHSSLEAPDTYYYKDIHGNTRVIPNAFPFTSIKTVKHIIEYETHVPTFKQLLSVGQWHALKDVETLSDINSESTIRLDLRILGGTVSCSDESTSEDEEMIAPPPKKRKRKVVEEVNSSLEDSNTSDDEST